MECQEITRNMWFVKSDLTFYPRDARNIAHALTHYEGRDNPTPVEWMRARVRRGWLATFLGGGVCIF